MNRTISAIFLGVLFYINPIAGEEKSKIDYWSIRVLGLTRHLIDVGYNANFFPLKLDKQAVYILNPGILIGTDSRIGKNTDIYLRTVQSLYIDCAVQPASYVAAMIFKHPVFKFNKFCIGGGIGGGINIRRNWQRYGKSGLTSRIVKDMGYFEGIIGPCIEVELAYAISPNKQWIINIVPAYPVLIFITAGLRIKSWSLS